MNWDNIRKSAKVAHVYLVKSSVYDKQYEVDAQKWMCTCTVGRTGCPSGKPCKHQHSVAKKYNLTAPNLLPYFNGEGRYLHALIALGNQGVRDRPFILEVLNQYHHPPSKDLLRWSVIKQIYHMMIQARI